MDWLRWLELLFGYDVTGLWSFSFVWVVLRVCVWVCVRLLWFVLFWVYWCTVIVCDFRLSLVCSLHLVAAVVFCGCSCCVGIWLVYCFLVACCLSGVVSLVLLFRALLRCVRCGGFALVVGVLLYCCGCCVYYLCCLVVWVVWFLGLR